MRFSPLAPAQADEATGKIVFSVASGLMMRPLFRPCAAERFQTYVQKRIISEWPLVRCVAWMESRTNQLCKTATVTRKKKRRTFFLMYAQIALVTSAEFRRPQSTAMAGEAEI